MKKVQFLNLILILSSTLILACGDNNKKTDDGKITAKSVNNIESNNCFEKFVGKPELLLSKDLVGQFVDFEGQSPTVEKVSEQIIKDINFATVNCKWKVNRKRRIVRLQNIKKIKLYKSKTAVGRFYDKYHTKSEAEKINTKEVYNKEVIDKVEDDNAKELGNKIIDFDFEYLNIDQVGDAAVWEHKVNNLIVLIGEYQFTVNVKLIKGNQHDLGKAILIAKAIIEKACN